MARAPKARVPIRKEPGAPALARKTASARGNLPPAAELKRTVIIEAIAPAVDGGRYPVKREVGAVLEVSADIFKEGHDVLVAFLLYRRADDRTWRETPM
jgi:starch synthase (maltosyl-transferring)